MVFMHTLLMWLSILVLLILAGVGIMGIVKGELQLSASVEVEGTKAKITGALLCTGLLVFALLKWGLKLNTTESSFNEIILFVLPILVSGGSALGYAWMFGKEE